MGKLCIEAAPWRAKAVFIDVFPYCQHAASLFMCIFLFLGIHIEFRFCLHWLFLYFFAAMAAAGHMNMELPARLVLCSRNRFLAIFRKTHLHDDLSNGAPSAVTSKKTLTVAIVLWMVWIRVDFRRTLAWICWRAAAEWSRQSGLASPQTPSSDQPENSARKCLAWRLVWGNQGGGTLPVGGPGRG